MCVVWCGRGVWCGEVLPSTQGWVVGTMRITGDLTDQQQREVEVEVEVEACI